MPRKILRAVLTTLLALLAASIFYIAVILGEPQEEFAAIQPMMDQPLLTASPAMRIEEEGLLFALHNDFPVPVLQPVTGGGMTFLSGESCDAAFDGRLGRMVTLRYLTSAGQELTVSSIYPARALSLVEKADYVLADVAGQTLAGLKSVRMENSTHIRLHAQGEEAIYVVTVPKMSSSELISITRSLQLYEGE